MITVRSVIFCHHYASMITVRSVRPYILPLLHYHDYVTIRPFVTYVNSPVPDNKVEIVNLSFQLDWIPYKLFQRKNKSVMQ